MSACLSPLGPQTVPSILPLFLLGTAQPLTALLTSRAGHYSMGSCSCSMNQAITTHRTQPQEALAFLSPMFVYL
jgi:hypothetical protein